MVLEKRLKGHPRNKIPILIIIFSLIKTNCLKNNELFKSNSTLSKGNRMIKMGILFLG